MTWAENAFQLVGRTPAGSTQITQDKAPEQYQTDGVGSSAPAKQGHAINISAADQALLESLAGQKFAGELLQMFGESENKEIGNPSITMATSDPIYDKGQRAQIHQEVRRIFMSRIDTGTMESGAMTAKMAKSQGGGRKRGRSDRGQPSDRPAGQYVHFTLYKDNKDTIDAVNGLARFLKVKPQLIGYAGTKDRRASTSQRCSVRYAHHRTLSGINGKIRGVVTGDYEYLPKPIHLGQLLGNEFTITVKDCHTSKEWDRLTLEERARTLQNNIQSALDHMTEHGWINYFGHQRFGTHKIGTQDIGKLILGDKYEEAVNALLHYDPEIAARAERGEVPAEAHSRDEFARHRACMLFQTDKDANEALKTLPRRYVAETAVLRHLTRSGRQSRKDFVGALMFITRGLRSMFLHAYQSYVWNHAASKRWELHGDAVVAGDLVIIDDDNSKPGNRSHENQDEDGIIHPADEADDDMVRVRSLSPDEASSGRYTIYDVVLPLPGFDVVYPASEIGTFYEEFMGRDENGGLDPHKMRRMRREFSLPGRYRKLMNRFLAKPSVEVRTYQHETEQMHPTDLDMITAQKSDHRKRPQEPTVDAEDSAAKKRKFDGDDESETPAASAVVNTADAANAELSEAADGEDGAAAVSAAGAGTGTEETEKLAAVLKFQLGKSAYATVVLRELMGDTPEAEPTGEEQDHGH